MTIMTTTTQSTIRRTTVRATAALAVAAGLIIPGTAAFATAPAGDPVAVPTPPPTSQVVTDDPSNGNGLGVTIRQDRATYSKVGDVITYTVTVTSNAFPDLYYVKAIDNFGTQYEESMALTLHTGDVHTFTVQGQHTITQADIDSGTVYNNVGSWAKSSFLKIPVHSDGNDLIATYVGR